MGKIQLLYKNLYIIQLEQISDFTVLRIWNTESFLILIAYKEKRNVRSASRSLKQVLIN